MSSKPPRKPFSPTAERTKMRQTPMRIQVRTERIERPARTSALLARVDVAKRLTATDITKLVRKAGFRPTGGGGGESQIHVELSSAVPWVEGRGWLDAAGTLQSWFATTTIGFIPDKPNQEQGVLYIWMDGLTAGDAYVAEIRVGGWSVDPQSPGTFNIGASDASHGDVHQTGASQTLSVFMPSVEGSMSLIRIDTEGLGGWSLDDVRVLHLGPLS
jgi:hypothetical protein